ncbi:PilN domain-containing protein [Martelella alba]|uniref:Tfp pilus assembly protein PilN n=1 Tax=Martelella alba TaxID=2590451 RepID=A0ABY2SI19_9HYPH|nr:PilN domain-containing protein [Martelella alba]TKI05010.1 hypothetical protein FCN80_15900 [Martelella alba]
MYQVNFLPWRQQRRRRRGIWLAAVLAAELSSSFGAAGLLVWRGRVERHALHRQTAALLQSQLQMQQRLLQRRHCLEQRRSLAGKLRRCQQARDDNHRLGMLFERLGERLPPDLWLTSVRVRAGKLAIGGCGRNYAAINETGRRLDGILSSVPWHWQELARQKNGAVHFRLQADWPARGARDAAR